MSRLRIVVAGMVGHYPVGGVAWDYLQYVIGLDRLGHDVYYHEDTWSWPFDPSRNSYVDDASYAASFLADFFETHAPHLRDKWHYRHLHAESLGMSWTEFERVAETADLFLNVSGASILPELGPRCTSVFIDTDPGYNQIVLTERPAWSENVDRWIASVRSHDRHATYAEAIHDPACRVPDAGLDWFPTRMPVVADLWTASGPAERGSPWTTILTWNAFKGPLVMDGVEYGSKAEEFERIIELPDRIDATLAVALGGVDAPADRLRAHGWQVQSAPDVTATPEDYLAFLHGSRGEVSIAKNVYVALRTGWFSTRTACYLAAGRPVVVQDTGFSAWMPTGEGLLVFDDVDGAAAGVDEVESHYEQHAAAAAEIARDEFGADRVLGELLANAGS